MPPMPLTAESWQLSPVCSSLSAVALTQLARLLSDDSKGKAHCCSPTPCDNSTQGKHSRILMTSTDQVIPLPHTF